MLARLYQRYTVELAPGQKVGRKTGVGEEGGEGGRGGRGTGQMVGRRSIEAERHREASWRRGRGWVGAWRGREKGRGKLLACEGRAGQQAVGSAADGAGTGQREEIGGGERAEGGEGVAPGMGSMRGSTGWWWGRGSWGQQIQGEAGAGVGGRERRQGGKKYQWGKGDEDGGPGAGEWGRRWGLTGGHRATEGEESKGAFRVVEQGGVGDVDHGGSVFGFRGGLRGGAAGREVNRAPVRGSTGQQGRAP